MNKHQQLFTLNIALLIQYAKSIGIGLTMGDAYRSPAQQLEFYSKGLSRTKEGNHGKRLAMDFNFFVNGLLTYEFEVVKPLGDFWEQLHPANRWGGDWNNDDIRNGFVDTSHFEMNIKN